jgi:hypothetical protein
MRAIDGAGKAGAAQRFTPVNEPALECSLDRRSAQPLRGRGPHLGGRCVPASRHIHRGTTRESAHSAVDVLPWGGADAWIPCVWMNLCPWRVSGVVISAPAFFRPILRRGGAGARTHRIRPHPPRVHHPASTGVSLIARMKRRGWIGSGFTPIQAEGCPGAPAHPGPLIPRVRARRKSRLRIVGRPRGGGGGGGGRGCRRMESRIRKFGIPGRVPLTSAAAWAEGSTDRASGGAHDSLPRAPEIIGPIRIPPKNADGSPPHFHPSPVSERPCRLVPRRRGRHASAHYDQARTGDSRQPHEKTFAPPASSARDPSFSGFRMAGCRSSVHIHTATHMSPDGESLASAQGLHLS